jgi:hypothetical protein
MLVYCSVLLRATEKGPRIDSSIDSPVNWSILKSPSHSLCSFDVVDISLSFLRVLRILLSLPPGFGEENIQLLLTLLVNLDLDFFAGQHGWKLLHPTLGIVEEFQFSFPLGLDRGDGPRVGRCQFVRELVFRSLQAGFIRVGIDLTDMLYSEK